MFKQKTCFRTQFSFEFSWFWPPKTKPKSSIFRYFFGKRRFYKKSQKPLQNNSFSLFFKFPASRKPPKSMPKRNRKKHRKKNPGTRFWHPFWLPRTSPNRSQHLQNRSAKRRETKLVLRGYANCPHLVASSRGAEVCDCLPGLSKD